MKIFPLFPSKLATKEDMLISARLAFPECQVEVDNDGKFVIYTNIPSFEFRENQNEAE